MSLQWLVLLTFAAFLQLAITATIELSDTDDNEQDTVIQNVDDTSTITDNPTYLDCSYYYRLTNAYSGPSLALDVNNDGENYLVKMDSISSNTGQFWQCIHLGNNVYNLRTQFLKGQYSLDIVNDGINTKPHMGKTGDYTGQRWHLIRLDDEAFTLSNDFTGNGKLLDVYSNSPFAQMSDATVNYSGHHWSFDKIGKIEDY